MECDESCYIVNGGISCVFVNVNECLSFDAYCIFVIITVSCMNMNFKVCLGYAIHYYVHGECYVFIFNQLISKFMGILSLTNPYASYSVKTKNLGIRNFPMSLLKCTRGWAHNSCSSSLRTYPRFLFSP